MNSQDTPPTIKNFAEPCPFESLLRLLLGQWTPLIIWTLQTKGELRFTELKHEVQGISGRVLTERLRQLEQHDIISRRYVAAIPPQVSYCLTDRGEELRDVLTPLNSLARRWVSEDIEKYSTQN
ncbi:winged helix-turn-helix transcriptional regulator [Permianibacter aggregans]|uniref:HxlR family transcriptional regulator n=1 Tax=Permianibacter aggregans TaxID=1510150 RepID=A0A4R6UIF6_9GAMM|nr:helix-turn-helix domain-containing protein [Permianibacter aggregans]QGX39961.1 transcriptional regulator [Permianibacter aggregans]TDQ46232.1 HxlR family transcriptional regulator [Permianibacter aggregans]